MINGIDRIIITLLDALHGITPIKICIGYELNGQILESWPIQHEIIKKCKPIYKEFEGWEKRSSKEWSEIAKQGYDSLPNTMKIYLQAIKEELKTDIAIISIGPNRNDTIVLDEDLF
jgi:adenylosuccinate synthase